LKICNNVITEGSPSQFMQNYRSLHYRVKCELLSADDDDNEYLFL